MSNFEFLEKHHPDMARTGLLAELYLYADYEACIKKICTLADSIAEEICIREKVGMVENPGYEHRLTALKYAGLLSEHIEDMFYEIQEAAEEAVNISSASSEKAEKLLYTIFCLCLWFTDAYCEKGFIPPEYIIPEKNRDLSEIENMIREQEEKPFVLPEKTENGNNPDTDLIITESCSEESTIQPAPEKKTKQIHDKKIRISAEILPLMNYALCQNKAVAIHSITIENKTDSAIENADIKVTSAPDFLIPFTRHIDRLPAKRTLKITNPEININGDFLAGFTEKLEGFVNISIETEDSILASENFTTTVLSFNEWHGTKVYPELLASFVTPNHPEISKLLARASEIAMQWTGDSSMDGYMSQDPNRALTQAAAIFAAIKEQDISLVSSAVDFDFPGQYIRFCDEILSQKLGTELDLSLLYASCLEASELHPLLITTENRVITGLWLEDKMFPECIEDDISLITKRLASGVNEIAVVQPSCLAEDNDTSFDNAREIAELSIITQTTEYIIDIHRARISRISPLPQRVYTDSGPKIVSGTPAEEKTVSAPGKLDTSVLIDSDKSNSNLPKIVQWERKLLDLGLRNNLINLRMTKTQIPLLTDSLENLERVLASGSELQILPKPEDCKLTDFSYDALNEIKSDNIIKEEFQNKRIRSALTEAQLKNTIKDLYRSAKLSLEENGANTLYMALGMLRWYETDRSTKPRYAPIILLPVEIVRKSSAQGYVIRLRDEEPQINITLLEKLKQDFNIIVKCPDPFPVNENGIDIRKILTIMRKAVMDNFRWDVLETASIGIFSFSQFVMWNDLCSREAEITKNKLVLSLMDGKLCWDAKSLQTDDTVDENDVLLPLPADASQLFAVRVSFDGESFVLHGPPGTGKSQTITLLIANALAQGKRVLFVAEKMAALEVVQKHLENIGIGPFCLELHSNKARKKSVLNQLRRATEIIAVKTPVEYEMEAEKIAQMRSELDCYNKQLHKPLPCGADLYTLINEYELHKNAPDIRAFDHSFIQSQTKQSMEKQHHKLCNMISAAKEICHPKDHPLRRIGCTQYSQRMKNSIQETSDEYKKQLLDMAEALEPLPEKTGIASPCNASDIDNIKITADIVSFFNDIPEKWSMTEAPHTYFENIIALSEHFSDLTHLKHQILESFEPDFLTLNGEALNKEFSENSKKWLVSRMLGTNKLINELKAFAKTPLTAENISEHISVLCDYQEKLRIAEELLSEHKDCLGLLYKGEKTDWDKISMLAAEAKKNSLKFRELYKDRDMLHKLCSSPEIKELLHKVSDCYEPFIKAKEAFDNLLCPFEADEESWLQKQISLCDTVIRHKNDLKEWIAYVSAAADVREEGLSNAVNSFEDGISVDEVIPSYKKALLCGLISEAIDDSETLNQFSGAVFNKKVEEYKKADQKLSQLSRREIYCRLASRIPDFTKEAAQSSELNILQRYIRSGGRNMSIRKMFEQIPDLLPRLCPCMLMSPISAAQFLDSKTEPFDIVVFDEASQLPTCKAVGVLARGESAVIVGDPKQMPPTSFFSTNIIDEDNLENEDLESILDECLALNMPQSHLLWHYRSRHESLIAFSNSRFYENKLLTFPSVNDRESKVNLIQVDGIFDRGKTRTNKAEAQAVVQEIIRRFKDPVLSGQSIGVVTFNIAQQHLIDDMMSEYFSQHPELEKLALSSDEPLFIKNLENVQGDERDVILFSVGFGPDEKGKTYMNFGPLNREGGQRRLNVAVSRARHEMLVFSSLRPEQIDINRSTADGVSALKAFLQYAGGAPIVSEYTDIMKNEAKTDAIALSVRKALKSHGYETALSVGKSEYRIDIGVVDKNDPDRYILGIMLDGDSYAAAKTTRDREIAQLGVLQGLGWNIHRVRCMDWWDNSEKELNHILRRLQELQASCEAGESSISPDEAEKSAESCSDEAEFTIKLPAKTPPLYDVAVLPERNISTEEFISPYFENDIKAAVGIILEKEAPISHTLLTSRVLQSFGINRAGKRTLNHLNNVLTKMKLPQTESYGTDFFWKKDSIPEEYVGFRVNLGRDCREINDVPVEEISNALCTVLYEQINMELSDLIKQTALKLGYAGRSRSIPPVIESAIDYAGEKDFITKNSNGKIVLTITGSEWAEKVISSFEG